MKEASSLYNSSNLENKTNIQMKDMTHFASMQAETSGRRQYEPIHSFSTDTSIEFLRAKSHFSIFSDDLVGVG